MSRRPTIEEFAHLAGVSRGTVSRVLNENSSVSDVTLWGLLGSSEGEMRP